MGKAKANTDDLMKRELEEITAEREESEHEKRLLSKVLEILEEEGDTIKHERGVPGLEWTYRTMQWQRSIINNKLRDFHGGRIEIRSHKLGTKGMHHIYYPHIRKMRKKGFTPETLEYLDRCYDSSNSNNERLKLMQPSEIVYYLLDHYRSADGSPGGLKLRFRQNGRPIERPVIWFI